MTLQNQFTSYKQTLGLRKLGLPDYTCDCVTSRYGGCDTFYVSDMQLKTRCIDSDNYVPCWSVGRLIELYEFCVGVKFSRCDDDRQLPLLEDVLEHIEHTINHHTFNFSKLED